MEIHGGESGTKARLEHLGGGLPVPEARADTFVYLEPDAMQIEFPEQGASSSSESRPERRSVGQLLEQYSGERGKPSWAPQSEKDSALIRARLRGIHKGAIVAFYSDSPGCFLLGRVDDVSNESQLVSVHLYASDMDQRRLMVKCSRVALAVGQL